MPLDKRRQPGESPISFKVDPQLIRDIDDIARLDARSRCATIRLALVEYVENHKAACQDRRATA